MIYIINSDVMEKYIGVIKKIKAQCSCFEKNFGDVFYTTYCGQMICLFKGTELIDKQFALTRREIYEIILIWIKKYSITRAYIRYRFSDSALIDFCKILKRTKVKVVLEFPDYPYENSYKDIIKSEDFYYRNKLHKYVGLCTSYGRYDNLFNIPCITLFNGIDIDEQPLKSQRNKDGSIVLLAVAACNKQHGYERIIKGIYNYYFSGGKKNIIFNVVGEGPQTAYYKNLVDKFELKKHVFFHGQLDGNELNQVYNNSDIGIGALGLYKVNVQSAAPIKTGEYCARGIPFIYGYDDISLNGDEYFAYQVSNDSTPIEMENVIAFYNKVYSVKDVSYDMRKFAKERLVWDKVLQPVIEYLR